MQSRGQIFIAVILLAIVAIILFSQLPKFFGREPERPEPKPSPSQPVFEKETAISPPKEEARKEETAKEAAKKEEKEVDSSSPVLLDLQPSGGLPHQTRKTYLSVKTNEKAACRYSDISGVYYEYMQGKFSTEDGFSHQVLISTLSEGESYAYYVKCIDEAGNRNINDSVISFWVNTPPDLIPPQRTNAYPRGETLPAGARSTMIGVSTDEPASCRYDRSAGTDYDSMDNNFSTDRYQRYHTATVINLAAGQSYGFYVRCRDLAGNKNIGDVLIYFDVADYY